MNDKHDENIQSAMINTKMSDLEIVEAIINVVGDERLEIIIDMLEDRMPLYVHQEHETVRALHLLPEPEGERESGDHAREIDRD